MKTKFLTTLVRKHLNQLHFIGKKTHKLLQPCFWQVWKQNVCETCLPFVSVDLITNDEHCGARGMSNRMQRSFVRIEKCHRCHICRLFSSYTYTTDSISGCYMDIHYHHLGFGLTFSLKKNPLQIKGKLFVLQRITLILSK